MTDMARAEAQSACSLRLSKLGAAGACLAIGLTTMGVTADPSLAADTDAWAALAGLAVSCVDGDVLTLSADAVMPADGGGYGPGGVPASRLSLNCSATIDLNGYTLVGPVKAFSGGELTITDSSPEKSGELLADLSGWGGAPTTPIDVSGASLLVDGAKVTAKTWYPAAAIGSGYGADSAAGNITLRDAQIIALGSIGADSGGDIGDILIESSRVTVDEGGIGAGPGKNGGDISLISSVVSVDTAEFTGAPRASVGNTMGGGSVGDIHVSGGELSIRTGTSISTGIGALEGSAGNVLVDGDATVKISNSGTGAAIGASNGTIGNIHVTGQAQVTIEAYDGLQGADLGNGGLIGIGNGATDAGDIIIDGDATVLVDASDPDTGADTKQSTTPWGAGSLIGTTGDVTIGGNAAVTVRGSQMSQGAGIGAPANMQAGTVTVTDHAVVDVDVDRISYHYTISDYRYPVGTRFYDWGSNGAAIGAMGGSSSLEAINIVGAATVRATGTVVCGTGIGGNTESVTIAGSAQVNTDGIGAGGCLRGQALQQITIGGEANVVSKNRVEMRLNVDGLGLEPGNEEPFTSDNGGVVLGSFAPGEIRPGIRPSINIIDNATVDARGGYGAGIGTTNGWTTTAFTDENRPLINIQTTGTVTAVAAGEGFAAGIGTHFGEPVDIAIGGGAIVTAQSSGMGAAIGSASGTGAFSVSIGDATVTATHEGTGRFGPESGAPAIGAGGNAPAPTVTLAEGASVTATTDSLSTAAIGPWRGVGGRTTIDAGATLTVNAGASDDELTPRGTNAVGGQAIDETSVLGELTVNGTLALPAGHQLLVGETGQQIGETGVVLSGDAADPIHGGTIRAAFTGTGAQLTNDGVIALVDVELDELTVFPNNTLVSYDVSNAPGAQQPEPVRVFAPMFAGSYRSLAAAPEGRNWVWAEKSADSFTTSTVFSGEPETELSLSEPAPVKPGTSSSPALTSTGTNTGGLIATAILLLFAAGLIASRKLISRG